jgi:hypothetical protein
MCITSEVYPDNTTKNGGISCLDPKLYFRNKMEDIIEVPMTTTI